MSEKTMVNKTMIKEIKKSKLSPFAVRRISKAIEHISEMKVSEIRNSGKIQKINIPGHDDVYMYRSSGRERIIFSISDEGKLVHEILTADDIRKLNEVK